MKKLVVIFISILGLVACGSTSMTAEECKTTNWQERGAADANSATDVLQFNQYVESCKKGGVTPNKEQYYSGFQDGLIAYCTFENGVERGKKGSQYYKACKEFKEFGEGYAKGVDIHIEERERREVEKLTRPTVENSKQVGGDATPVF